MNIFAPISTVLGRCTRPARSRPRVVVSSACLISTIVWREEPQRMKARKRSLVLFRHFIRSVQRVCRGSPIHTSQRRLGGTSTRGGAT